MKCEKCNAPLILAGVKYPQIKYIHIDGVIGGIPTRVNETFIFRFQCTQCLIFSEYITDKYESAKEFYKSIINEPMKNVIEQIRKIKGVVTVEKVGENMFVGIFEPKKEPLEGRQYVKCTTEKEFEFVKIHTGLDDPSSFDYWYKYPCVCVNGTDSFSSEAFPERAYRVIGFDTYLLLFLLGDKWTAFNKPKSLTPEELVDGRIYVDEYSNEWCNIFRYAGSNDNNVFSMYSLFCTQNDRNSLGGYLKSTFIRHATPSEAQSLIRAEVEHGYFHELKDSQFMKSTIHRTPINS